MFDIDHDNTTHDYFNKSFDILPLAICEIIYDYTYDVRLKFIKCDSWIDTKCVEFFDVIQYDENKIFFAYHHTLYYMNDNKINEISIPFTISNIALLSHDELSIICDLKTSFRLHVFSVKKNELLDESKHDIGWQAFYYVHNLLKNYNLKTFFEFRQIRLSHVIFTKNTEQLIPYKDKIYIQVNNLDNITDIADIPKDYIIFKLERKYTLCIISHDLIFATYNNCLYVHELQLPNKEISKIEFKEDIIGLWTYEDKINYMLRCDVGYYTLFNGRS